MKVICLEEDAFFKLVELTVERLSAINKLPLDKWIDEDEAMSLLRIKSKTTLQKLRDEMLINFSQPSKKIILYDRLSIQKYIEVNSKSKQ